MTDEELDALVKRLDDMSDLSRDHAAGLLDLGHKVAVNQAITAITTLRAQLEVTQDKLEIERALTDGAHRRAREAEKEAHDCGAEREAWKARADRAEAALAAQIEADAEICTYIIDNYDCMKADKETYQPMWVQKVAKGMVSLARQDIRNQPHDRTALQSAIRAAKVEAWRKAEVATLGLATGHACRATIRALIEREGGE